MSNLLKLSLLFFILAIVAISLHFKNISIEMVGMAGFFFYTFVFLGVLTTLLDFYKKKSAIKKT